MICAVAVGLTTGGILGALLAPPIVATFRVLGSYVHAKLLDYPPFVGRPLPDPRPRTYRRKVTGRELETRRGQNAEGAPIEAPSAGTPRVDFDASARHNAESGNGSGEGGAHKKEHSASSQAPV